MTLEEYLRAKKRAQKLKERLDRSDPSEAKEDLRVARKLLDRILRKIEEYKKTNNIDSNSKYDSDNTTANFTYHEPEPDFMEDNRTDEQLMDDLGIIYAIFGRFYKKNFNYHEYTVHFKRLCESHYECFCRVSADIYEDSILIAYNIEIAFWPLNHGDTICGDMGISSRSENGFRKYITNGSSVLYQHLLYDLKDIWNYYFGLVPLRLEANAHEMKKTLSATERDAVISRVERQLINGEGRCWITRHSIKEMGFYTRAYYNTLESFLKESGIIYKVEEDGVYVLYNDEDEREYLKLIGINRVYRGYKLYLSTIF